MKALAIWLLCCALALLSFATAGVGPPGSVFLSPDNRRFVKLLYYDRDYHYAITDRKTGKVTVLEAEYSPIFAISWSPDSQSIFAVAHVARGSVVQILHLHSGQWNKYTIDAPEQQSHESMVIDWSIQPSVLTTVCNVGLQKENGEFYACYENTFDVDPSTGATSNIRKRIKTFDECSKLKSKFELQ
jgi:WD40 repeat protein